MRLLRQSSFKVSSGNRFVGLYGAGVNEHNHPAKAAGVSARPPMAIETVFASAERPDFLHKLQGLTMRSGVRRP